MIINTKKISFFFIVVNANQFINCTATSIHTRMYYFIVILYYVPIGTLRQVTLASNSVQCYFYVMVWSMLCCVINVVVRDVVCTILCSVIGIVHPVQCCLHLLIESVVRTIENIGPGTQHWVRFILYISIDRDRIGNVSKQELFKI